MLEIDEIKRRIHAARILRQWNQLELQKALAKDGLGSREFGRIERGELTLTKIRRQAIASALRVPETWFLAETVDEIVGYIDPASTAPSGGRLLPPGPDLDSPKP